MSTWTKCVGAVRFNITGLEFGHENDLRAARTRINRIHNLLVNELDNYCIGAQWLDSCLKLKFSFYNKDKFCDGTRSYAGVVLQIYVNQRRMTAPYFAKQVLPHVTKALLRQGFCWIIDYDLIVEDGVAKFIIQR